MVEKKMRRQKLKLIFAIQLKGLMDAYRAIEALAVIIMRQCFNPSIAGFDWETACKAFGRK